MTKKLRLILGLCLVLLLLLGTAAFFWFAPSSPYRFGNYIPANLDDAHADLLKNLPPEEIQNIRDMTSEDEMIQYHMGLGTGIRNAWALWSGSRLSRYFNQLGIHHPDDMSGIILDTFWCKLHHQPFRLEERIAYYQAYWRAARVPPDLKTPSGELLEFGRSFPFGTNDPPRILHLSKDSQGTLWTYEYEEGLQPLTPENQKIIDSFDTPKK